MKLRILLANFLITSVLLTGSFDAQAQLKRDIDYSGFFDSYYYHQKYSFVAGVNMPFYFGDLCSSLGCTKLTPGITVGGGIKLWPRVYFGGEFSYFSLEADDEQSDRNYSFTSKNYELLAVGRYYLVEDIIRKHMDIKKKPKLVKPYLTAGIGLNYANPTATATLNDTIVYDLNELEEESFPKLIVAVPVGLGFQFDLSRRVHLIAEGMYRLTFSDYLDGISKTASSDANDAYLTLNLKVQYNPFAKRMKRKQKKIDPELIKIEYSDSTSSNSSPKAKPSESQDDKKEYQEGGINDEYNEGEAPSSEDEETITEEEIIEKVEEAVEEQYDEDGFLITDPEEKPEEESNDDYYDEGW